MTGRRSGTVLHRPTPRGHTPHHEGLAVLLDVVDHLAARVPRPVHVDTGNVRDEPAETLAPQALVGAHLDLQRLLCGLLMTSEIEIDSLTDTCPPPRGAPCSGRTAHENLLSRIASAYDDSSRLGEDVARLCEAVSVGACTIAPGTLHDGDDLTCTGDYLAAWAERIAITYDQGRV